MNFSFHDACLRDSLPALDDVLTTPFFARDGSLVNEWGYHASARVFLAPGDLQVARVSVVPTPEEVADAVRFVVEEALADFPLGGLTRAEIMEKAFTEQGVPALTHSLALILLPFARNMIAGPTPGHIINKPAPGTGAGFLTDVCSIIATGKATAPLTMPTNKEEVGKTLTAALMDNEKILFWDNISHSMDSAELASAMTAPQEGYKARILGRSQTALVRIMAAWVFTANTLTMSPELLRRCILIDLNRKVPDPANWQPDGGYRHADVRAWVGDNRAELVHACLTIIQNWVAAGMVKQTEDSLGSFENWAGVMGGILKSACIGGFLGNRSELTGLSDGRDDDLGELAQAVASAMFGQGDARLYIGNKADAETRKGRIGLFNVLHAMPETLRLEGWGYRERFTDTGVEVEYHNTKKAGLRFRGAAKQTFRVRLEDEDRIIRFETERDAHAKVNCYRMVVV